MNKFFSYAFFLTGGGFCVLATYMSIKGFHEYVLWAVLTAATCMFIGELMGRLDHSND